MDSTSPCGVHVESRRNLWGTLVVLRRLGWLGSISAEPDIPMAKLGLA